MFKLFINKKLLSVVPRSTDNNLYLLFKDLKNLKNQYIDLKRIKKEVLG